ncbi:hypothetical protein JCM8547_000655 [Rhodosporidiobolus lusitaniae]
MRTSLAALAVGATLVSTAIAAPSPKFREMRSKKAASRFAKGKSGTPVAAASYSLTDVPGIPSVSAPVKNIWKEFTAEEAAEVSKFLIHYAEDLNITTNDLADSWSNTIGVIDVATPNKTEALQYLSGTGPVPPRYAYASINFAATDEPYVEDYLVGPLPVSNETTYSPYGFRTSKRSSRIRNYDADQDKTYEWQRSIASEISDIVEDLLGKPADEYELWGIDPLWHEDGDVVSWVAFWGNPATFADGQTLLPQGLYLKTYITGRNPENWRLGGLLYNDVFYTSIADFRAAWSDGTMIKATRNDGEGDAWIGTDKQGEDLPFDDRAPPMQIAPGGQRFAVDQDEQYVKWGDFEFFWSFRRDTAVRLWDVKYKGEVILFEAGLTEALAHYAGNDPMQSGTAYLDTYYGFGPYALELIPGYDCPTYAAFANTSYSANEETIVHKNSLCFFETDLGYPLQRHSSNSYVSITHNVGFVMRSVSTIGNYDYTLSTTFTMDGSVFFDVSASGYIQSAFYAHNEEFGYKIHDGLSGSMHDHVLNFKLDVDILGQSNTVGFHTIEPFEQKPVWSNTTRKTMHLVRSELANETGMNWPENGKSMVLIYNKDEKNKYGEDRAWRIMPTLGAGMHSTIVDSSNLGPSINFATKALYFTKHSDSEAVASHPYNPYDAYNPVIDFADYLNDESLAQEDVVVWANLGMHHVPHTGDLPNTVQTTARAGLVMTPHNYLLGDPSRQTSQMIRINYNSSAEETVSSVLTFGAERASGLFNLTDVQWDPQGYENTFSVRFPYDKTNPGNSSIGLEATA